MIPKNQGNLIELSMRRVSSITIERVERRAINSPWGFSRQGLAGHFGSIMFPWSTSSDQLALPDESYFYKLTQSKREVDAERGNWT